MIGDFAALVTVFCISAVGYQYRNDVNIPLLDFPHTYAPIVSNRAGWIVETFGKNPVWILVISFLPAISLTLVLFFEQHLTTMIANKKENKLKVSEIFIFSV